MLDLGLVTQGLSNSLYKAATNAFTHMTGNEHKPGRATQNS